MQPFHGCDPGSNPGGGVLTTWYIWDFYHNNSLKHSLFSKKMVNENLRRDIGIIFRSERQRSPMRDISSNKELDTAKILYSLYNRNKNHEEEFKEALEKVLSSEISANSCDYLAFDLLMRIGDLEHAFSILNGYADDPSAVIHQMDSLRILKILVRMEFILNNKKYDEIQLKKILDGIKASRIKVTPKVRARGFELRSDDSEHRAEDMFNRIINLIDEKRMNFLEKRIGGEIYEEDIKIIEKEISSFKLTDNLQKSLEVIKNYNPSNEQEYAQNTGYLRTFLESFIGELSTKISLKKEESIKKIPNETKFISDKAYLKNNGILDEKEGRLLNSIYGILSSDSGSHILSTPQEKYRLLLNMTIEIVVLIFSNFKGNLTNIKSENDKAREMLGGRAEAGLPSVYGTAQEKLKQLKGYGGKLIEEMREEILKEIEKEEKIKD